MYCNVQVTNIMCWSWGGIEFVHFINILNLTFSVLLFIQNAFLFEVFICMAVHAVYILQKYTVSMWACMYILNKKKWNFVILRLEEFNIVQLNKQLPGVCAPPLLLIHSPPRLWEISSHLDRCQTRWKARQGLCLDTPASPSKRAPPLVVSPQGEVTIVFARFVWPLLNGRKPFSGILLLSPLFGLG